MRRDTLEKHVAPLDGIANYVAKLLEEIQNNIFQKALKHRESMTRTVDTYEEFKKKSKREVSSLRIGTEQQKPRKKSRMKQRLQSVAFLLTETRLPEYVW